MEKANLIDPLLVRAEEYGKSAFDLIKLKTLNKTADITSTLLSRGAVVLSVSIFLILINIGLSFWLGEILGKTYYGFFCVAGFYAVTGFTLYFYLHDTIKKRVANFLISQMFS